MKKPSGGKKKIAVVIPKYGLVGGGEQFVSQLTEKIALNPRYDVHVFANKWKAVSGKVSFHFVPLLRFPRFLTTVSFAFFANVAIARQDFDLIHTHDRIFHADIFTMHGVPHRFWVREVRKKRMSLFDRVTAWVERRLIADQRCRFLLPVSTLAMEKFRQEFAVASTRVKVIHPGIEFARFNLPNRAEKRAQIRKKFGLCAADFLVLFVGMNFELKGLDTVIFALAKAKEKLPGKAMKLLVVGKGDQGKYRKIADDLGVGEDVIFAGVQAEGIEEIYAASDVCALLSGFDTFGMTVLEAMAASLPVIISTQVGAKDIVTDGEQGFIVAKDDAETVSAYLVSLCDEPRRERMGRAAMQQAAQYSWDAVAGKVVTIYEKILSAGP
ncbi:MAG: glycosyltransferase family 4 protein [Deltaproteobacteria bacterium]|nr:glycosyltransferase family 4 protein [Deltaproteobacteria bacterium]